MAKLKNTMSEDALQESCVNWLMLQRNMGHLNFYAVPNGGTRHPREAKALKKRGVVPGVPDLILLIPSREYVGVRAPASTPRILHCELKRPSHNGKLKGDQLDWQNWLIKGGFYHAVIRSLDELIALVKSHTVIA